MPIWLCALLFRAAHCRPSEAAAALPIPAPSTHILQPACAGGHYDEYVADFHDWRPGPIDDAVWETPDVCRDHPDAVQAHHVDSGLRLEVARQAPNRHWGECWSMQDSRHWGNPQGSCAVHREWCKEALETFQCCQLGQLVSLLHVKFDATADRIVHCCAKQACGL